MAVARLISAANSSIVHTVTTSTVVGGILKELGQALVGKAMNAATVASGSTCAFMVPTADVWQLPHSVTSLSSGVIGDYAYLTTGTFNVTSDKTGNGPPVGLFHKVVTQEATKCEVRMFPMGRMAI